MAEINTNLDTTPLPPNNLVAKDPVSAELAGYVRTKTFGRDVRESIARSIELNSTRSKSAEILANETLNVANDLTDRFNQQIGALTEDSEVIDARGGKVNLGQRLAETDEQLGQVTNNYLNQMDVYSNDYDHLNTPVLDGNKISNILNDPTKMYDTFYLKSGSYLLVNPIIVNHEVSLYIDDDAFIIAHEPMEYMLYYRLVGVSGKEKRKAIRGGKWDGNGLANTCLHFKNTANVVVEDMQISNPLIYGMDIQGGYELIGNNLNFVNTILTNVEAEVDSVTIGNTAINVKTFDAIFNNITIVNYTTGIELQRSANYFHNVHMWCSHMNRLSSPYNIGILERTGINFFDKVYFDTYNLGYYAAGGGSSASYLTHCLFGYNDTYPVEGKTPVYITNASTRPIVFSKCGFRYDRKGSTNVAQISTGNNDLLQFRDCDFPTPTTLTAIPKNSFTPKIYKFKFTFSGLSEIAAGEILTVEKDITRPPYNFKNLSYEDSVIFNTLEPSWGVVLTPYVLDNKVRLRFLNTTNVPITPSDTNLYVTIIKNYDNKALPYIQ